MKYTIFDDWNGNKVQVMFYPENFFFGRARFPELIITNFNKRLSAPINESCSVVLKIDPIEISVFFNKGSISLEEIDLAFKTLNDRFEKMQEECDAALPMIKVWFDYLWDEKQREAGDRLKSLMSQ